MLSCLRTGDEKSAHLCLERLTERFGSENERLMALRGLFQEAIAKDDAELKQVLGEYDAILIQDPSNMVCILQCLEYLSLLTYVARYKTTHFSSQDVK
jgi:hypothetical protein